MFFKNKTPENIDQDPAHIERAQKAGIVAGRLITAGALGVAAYNLPPTSTIIQGVTEQISTQVDYALSSPDQRATQREVPAIMDAASQVGVLGDQIKSGQTSPTDINIPQQAWSAESYSQEAPTK